ncbi:alpha/beta hydrolase [Chitinivorax sp. B]|uniref:alpha/beta fold hydrolase n=1 Tax=Chitinivorax sp. B TaxID=2502235 RepID=UPI0010F6F87F|nr:alpha/beta hydrolase [Chitinivorax sp. B]
MKSSPPEDLSYSPCIQPIRESLTIRGLQHQFWHWGDPHAPLLVMLHGWMDSGISFQFLVDALQPVWHVVAPDWRGFGGSDWNHGSYWFPDYVADLDAMLQALSPDRPVMLVGHSMGGIVACLYAGLRPDRVTKLVSLEGFGLPATEPQQAVQRMRNWLDEQRDLPTFGEYAGDVIVARLMRNNPRLSRGKAEFLARHLTQGAGEGNFTYLADPSHKMVNPVLYRLEEAKAIWREVTATTLWLASDSDWLPNWLKETPEQFQQRMDCFRDFRYQQIPDSGHMLHQDQPLAVALALDTFFTHS